MAFIWMLSMAVTYHYIPLHIIQALQTAVIPIIVVSKVSRNFSACIYSILEHSNFGKLPQQVNRSTGSDFGVFASCRHCGPYFYVDSRDRRPVGYFLVRLCRRSQRYHLPSDVYLLELGCQESGQSKETQLKNHLSNYGD